MGRRLAGWMFAGLVAASLAPVLAQVRGGTAKGRVPTADVVDRLDYVFQERFRSTEGNIFGLSRIPVTPEHRQVVHWKPDQELEKKVARQLSEQGLAGAFVLAKPGIPRFNEAAEPVKKMLAEPPTGRNAVSRPILLSTGEAPQSLPTMGQVLPGIRASAAAFQKGDRHEFDAGDWSIVARPIRAGTECVDCHRKMTGDKNLAEGAVLGIAMYAFTPLAGAATP